MALELSAPPECAECGGSPVHHRLAYITVVMDDLTRPLFSAGLFSRRLSRGLQGITGWLSPRFMGLLTKLGLAKEYGAPDGRTTLLGEVIWKEAEARGIRVREWRLFDLPRNMFLATFPDGRQISYEGVPLPYNGIERVSWMDDKGVLKRKFTKLDLPVARGGSYFTLRGAEQALARLAPPVIAKPHSGSASRHTTLHIDTPEKLAAAFASAKRLSPFVVIEEELVGPVHRMTVVDGKFAAGLRRFWPRVIGDGVHTVRELVEKENGNPLRSGPYFTKIELSEKAAAELARQGLTVTSVPSAQQSVRLHQKMNWLVGGTTEDVTDIVHPDNRALFEAVARALKAPLVGIDFIIEDVTRSWKEQDRCGVLECNSLPFIEVHHLPFSGKSQNVAGKIWDMVS